MQTITHAMDKHQDPVVQHRELHSTSCNKPCGKEDEKYTYVELSQAAIHQEPTTP